MNILFLRNILILIILLLGQSSFSQVLEQPSFTQDLSILKDLQRQNQTKVDQSLISENQNVTNTDNNPQIDLSQSFHQKELKEKSMLRRYFYTLVGKDLNIYGSNEFSQLQDDSLLFF